MTNSSSTDFAAGSLKKVKFVAQLPSIESVESRSNGESRQPSKPLDRTPAERIDITYS